MSTKAARSLPWWVYLVTGAAWIIVELAGARLQQQQRRRDRHPRRPGHPGRRVAEFLMVFVRARLEVAARHPRRAVRRHRHRSPDQPGRDVLLARRVRRLVPAVQGRADIVLAFLTKQENDAWWLGLIVGIVEVLLGFWAAGRFDRSAYLLVVLVAAIALARGITDIIMAFRVRGTGDRGRRGGRRRRRPRPPRTPAADPGRATTTRRPRCPTAHQSRPTSAAADRPTASPARAATD